MMGMKEAQEDMFSYQVNLDKRVRPDHPMRSINRMIDFTFVRQKVARCYGYNGNVSVDPVVVMKMMFLLFHDDIASERELMKIIPERLDYMWFLGYGLDDKIPDHSILSKARKRWGTEVFEEMFVRVVWQCVKAGLVGGDKIHVDASLVDANASKNSVVQGPPELIDALKKLYRQEEGKLEEGKEPPTGPNRGMVSRTDPEAPVVRHGNGDSRPRYKNHRAVDAAKGVITAVETTAGDAEENRR
jgi:transposase